MADEKKRAEALIPHFQFEKHLNQDQAGRRTILYGHIHSEPALLIFERAPFSSSVPYLSSLPASLSHLQNLGANDVYFWYLASSSNDCPKDSSALPSDLKLNLIYPCTETHIKKYSRQGIRLVHETPQIYASHIRPYMERKRSGGRLQWVYNIIEGATEVEDVIYRTPLGTSGNEGFLLLPDLNWDRKTLSSLHLLGLVERRDIWSLRDLKKHHVPWLRHMKDQFLQAAARAYGLEDDQVKLYVHYQPTYYHFHVHIVHVELEAGATQATGKALALDMLIEWLVSMEGGEEVGLDAIELSYTVGEASELWTDIFEPLKKEKRQPAT